MFPLPGPVPSFSKCKCNQYAMTIIIRGSDAPASWQVCKGPSETAVCGITAISQPTAWNLDGNLEFLLDFSVCLNVALVFSNHSVSRLWTTTACVIGESRCADDSYCSLVFDQCRHSCKHYHACEPESVHSLENLDAIDIP